MAVDKDSASWLPEPPPPRPARRDAAIDAALRTFAGEAPSPASPGKGTPEPWTVRHRYQLGAFATAALALVIFVPVALTGVSDKPTPEPREVPQAGEPRITAPAAEEPPRVQAPPQAQQNVP